MDDFFELLEPTYGEMLKHINDIKEEVEYLDEDTLIEEIIAIQHFISGKEAKRIQQLIFKNRGHKLLEDEEMQFLKNIYLVYHCGCAVVVDEKEEDD